MDNHLTPSASISNATFHGAFHGDGSSFDFFQDNSLINRFSRRKKSKEHTRTLQEMAPTLLQNMPLIQRNGVCMAFIDAFMHSIINKPLFVSSVRNIWTQHANNNQCPLVPIIDAAFNAGMNCREAWKNFNMIKTKIKRNEIQASYRVDRGLEPLFAKSTTNRPRSRRREDNKQTNHTNKPTNDTIRTNKENQLSAFLNKMNLSQYYRNFARNAFNEDFNEVTDVTAADLRSMGIAKMAHIKKIMRHIEELKEMKEEIEKKPTVRHRRDRDRDRVRPNHGDKHCSRSRSRNGNGNGKGDDSTDDKIMKEVLTDSKEDDDENGDENAIKKKSAVRNRGDRGRGRDRARPKYVNDCSNTSVQGDDSTDDKLTKEFLTDSEEDDDDDESEDDNVNVTGDENDNEIKTSLCDTVASEENVILTDAFDIYYDSHGTSHCVFNDNDKQKTIERIRQKGGGFPFAPLPSPASPPSPGFYEPSPSSQPSPPSSPSPPSRK